MSTPRSIGDSYYREARQLRESGDYIGVLNEIRLAISNYPHDPAYRQAGGDITVAIIGDCPESTAIKYNAQGIVMPRRKCPKCGSSEVMHILFGLPTPEAFEMEKRGEVVLGGCCVGISEDGSTPKRHCKKCGHEWGKMI